MRNNIYIEIKTYMENLQKIVVLNSNEVSEIEHLMFKLWSDAYMRGVDDTLKGLIEEKMQ